MKKLISWLGIITVAFSLFSSMGTVQVFADENSQVNVELAGTTVKGTVSEVYSDRITITDDDGNKTTFLVTDSTEYTVEMNSANAFGEGSTPPEMSNGNGQQGGTPPEKPSGDMQQDGTPLEMPLSNGQRSGEGTTPPEIPNGNGQQGETPPEKPEGDMQQDGTPPEKPEGDMQQDGTPPEKPDGNMQPGEEHKNMTGNEIEASAEMLTVGTTVTVTLATDGTAKSIEIQRNGNDGGGFGGGFGGNTNIAYEAVKTYESDSSENGTSYISTGKDENAVLVTSGNITLDSISVDRNSTDSTGGDNSSFYGVGAAVLTTGGTVNIADSTITTDAAGGAGVFAYGDGTAYISDSTITTRQNTSGGIHVAGGGTLYAWDLDVETNGESSAAIRSDRGSGTMVIDGGSYTSNGTGSPAIYSTADITVNNSELTANGSESICIEGKNSIRLYDCNLTGNMSDDSRNDCTWNVILYQSMSGDSEEGNSLFEMVGGTLTAENGGVMYSTNTESTFILSNVDIITSDECEFLLKCTGNSNQRGWGSAGKNGADCSFSAISQTMTGDVIWDSISTLDFYMTDGSTLTGAFMQDESCAGNGGDGYASLNIEGGCTWTVTKDSYVTSLATAGSIVDENGNQVSIIGTEGTIYVEGTSDLTITVDNYSTSPDLSGCKLPSTFNDFAVEKQ